MIKILHTADLHLGKVFHDHSLLEDQAAMLEDLARLLDDGSFAALVIAGDVYDRSIPPPEAVELFGSFLAETKKRSPSTEIIVIPGNHDSASRLGFGRELFARLGIRFGVSAEECAKPLIVERGGERCAFFLLPFLSPGTLSAEEAARRMKKARQEAAGAAYSVLAAHLFATGGEEAGSERVFLGNAERVNISLFKGFDYIALGHLHRCQHIGKKAWYSGSPLAYSFGEAAPTGAPTGAPKGGQEKFFLSVELKEGGAKVDKIPINPRRKLASISGPFARFSGDISADSELLAAKDDYLEIRLSDRGITENARDILRKRFPRLLSIRQDEALTGLSSAARASRPDRMDAPNRSIETDFKDFLLSLYGEADNEELDLFKSLLAESEAEELL